MTPFQFAKAECSNYIDGACKGIGINDDGTQFSFGPKPKCVLSNSGTRCAFFEECVLPMIPKIEPTPVDDVVKGDILRSRNRAYVEAEKLKRVIRGQAANTSQSIRSEPVKKSKQPQVAPMEYIEPEQPKPGDETG